MKPEKVLSIGYVGHRHGERLTRAAQQIQNDVQQSLRIIQTAGQTVFETYQSTGLFAGGDLSFRAIGGIAEGADRLVIQILHEKNIPVSIVNSACSETECIHIIQQLTLEMSSVVHLDFEGKFGAHEQLIQSRSDILIAVWDGKKKQGGSGGAVRAVHNALSFGIPVIWIHATDNHAEPVLLTRRSGEPVNSLELVLNCSFDEAPLNQSDLAQYLSHSVLPDKAACQDKALERYLTGVHEWGVTNWLWKKAFQLSHFEWSKFFNFSLSHALNDVIASHLQAVDMVSGNMANRYRVSVLGLYLLSAFAVFWASAGYIFEEEFHHFSVEHFQGIHIAGWSEIFVIVLIIFWFKWGDYRKWHGIWIHGRYLAEMLRMHKILEPVIGVAPFMLKQDSVHSNWAHWLYRRYATAAPLSAHRVLNTTEAMVSYRSMFADYLDEQISYHQKKVESEEVRHRFLHYGGYSLFALTLLAALLHLFGLGGHELAPWLALMTIVFPAFGAAFHAIMVQEEVEKLIHTSREMIKQLKAINVEVNAANDMGSLRKKAIEAADLMAKEASSWHQMVAFKKLELPA